MKRLAALLLPGAALSLAACAGAPPATAPGTAPFSTLAARFTARATEQEAAGELRRALESWKVVAALQADAAEPKRRVVDLTARLGAEAERRFRDGAGRLQDGDVDAARREYLLSLAADPDHAGSLEALRKLSEPEATPHTVVAGETFEDIARKRYGDPAQAPIVARVNDLDPAAKPVPGTILTLPDLAPPGEKPARPRASEADAESQDAGSAYDTEPGALGEEQPQAPTPAGPAATVRPAKAADPGEAQLAEARELFRAAKFEDAGKAADRLAGNRTVGARARELAGDAWFAVGDAALKQERFADAVAAYRKAAPARKDVPAALAAVERLRKEKAEQLYIDGVRFFINQKLAEAIRSWEQTLELNPEHPKAPGDIEKARGLLQKLRELR